ncbi:2291_t:CDS:2 [Dentiscutata erythropus]|uniref:2291_t:CDS:1 n=1 Tax=Dentiscutata erythropus TaxID=1348616 RepID=A0A9N8ZDT5_9GLOM|nr:2291_t:CDS:2 [Dentiscutata erythropus]
MQKSEFEAVKKNQDLNFRKVRVLESRGHKPLYPSLEQELLKYVQEKHGEGLSVTTSMIENKAKEIAKSQELGDIKASRGWIKWFKRRNNLVQHCQTQVA